MTRFRGTNWFSFDPHGVEAISYSNYGSSETSRQCDPLQATGAKLDQNYDNNIQNNAVIAAQNWSLL